jgi:hypothetical protein
MMLKLEFISGDPEDDTPTIGVVFSITDREEIMEKTGLVPLGYICEPVVEVELEEEE